jgi:hypothetical protein
MTFKNLSANIDKAITEGADQTVAKTGGGSEPPAAGACNLRLVGYIETGKHKNFKGKVIDTVELIFEVSGKNHPPIETDNGPVPHRITEKLTLSLNEKARFFKLFSLLNYKGTAKHCASLALEQAAYRGKIVHREYEVNGQKRIAAELYDKKLGVYTITPPRIEAVDEDGQPTGEYREVKVAPALSQPRIFLWNQADMEQWQSLFIDGQWDERKDDKGNVTAPAKSKNVLQLKITSALNYKGSPIQKLLANGGAELELPADGVVDDEPSGEDDGADEGTTTARTSSTKPVTSNKPKAAAKGDPLAGIGDE